MVRRADRAFILEIRWDLPLTHISKWRAEKSSTRGNGEIGEVITGNARVFQNIPLKFHIKVN